MIITDGLEWVRIYYVRGKLPAHARYSNAITDPPCAGWQHAFLMRGERLSTIFCPYTLESYTVPNKCSEIAYAESPEEFRAPIIESMIRRKWKTLQTWGLQRDYDTCTRVMKLLNWDVPKQILTGGGEDTRTRGGKEVANKLLRPVNAASKRGKFLKWFIDGDLSRSIRETMVELSMTRSNTLSYLFNLQRDHGIGYELVGDIATITLPEDCLNPFEDNTWLK